VSSSPVDAVESPRARRRAFWLHVALFVGVNAVYLALAWPLWLWVTAFWSVGLGVHASLVFGPRLGGAPSSRDRAGDGAR
jgi:hypothetical protein